MPSFRDHFSGHASDYAAARSTYPESLFVWLASLADCHELAWDVATGNGQAALSLARHFEKVHATDASAEQIANAPESSNIDFLVEPAEEPSLPENSVDLITVAQAVHWFDLERFFDCAKRVLRENGVIAIWCYELCRINSEVDAVVSTFYESLDEFWPPERALVESGYRTIPFPFDEIEVPEFQMECNWELQRFLAYLDSWSAARRCHESTGSDPIEGLRKQLIPLWGDTVLLVKWPLSFRVGRA